jgi:hypothetical protein
VGFGHFQFYAGQFDGLNQSVTLSGLEKSNKNFQPNLFGKWSKPTNRFGFQYLVPVEVPGISGPVIKSEEGR